MFIFMTSLYYRNLPKSADIAALIRLATPPTKNPATVIKIAFTVLLLGESVKKQQPNIQNRMFYNLNKTLILKELLIITV